MNGRCGPCRLGDHALCQYEQPKQCGCTCKRVEESHQ